MINLELNALVHGFRVLREGDIPRLAAHYWKLQHEKTGATLYYTTRDDGQKLFSVGFRTLPENDTGVFHILEHSCLDGSEHFPLKEPFVNLIKTSMATGLNAVTYSDKTLYYFISTNEQDFMNLMAVYMDAVFYPLLLSDRRIFEKEAWHFEPDGNGGVSISGVVFNEMQGRENMPEYIMWKQNDKQLFPDVAYHTSISGGDPASIPDLSYEQFVETYKRHYDPANAIIYLSGDMSLDTQLAYIDSVLAGKGNSGYDCPAPADLQTPVVSPDGEVYYQLPETEELAANTRIMLSYVLDADTPAESLAMDLLSRYLAENTEQPLSRAVLAADVGKDFHMWVDSHCRQPVLAFTICKSDPERAETYRGVILDTLRTLVAEGFDKARLADLIAGHETDCRRASINISTGYAIMETVLRNQVQYGDFCPVDGLDALRAALDEDELYFEHLVERLVLNSEHWAMTKCIPSRTVTAERREAMQARCAAEAARLAAIPGGYDELTAHVAAFNEYLLAPDSPEAEASVPHLTPADLGGCPEKRDMAVETATIGGEQGTALFYEADTDGMVLAGVLLELTAVPEEDLFYAACLRRALLSLPTASHTLPEMTDAWLRVHTHAGVDLRVEKERAYLSLVLDAPEEKLADAAALLDEYIRETVFDRDILRNLFANAAGIRNRMISGGNGTALQAALRSMTVNGAYQEHLVGVTSYRRYAELADRFDELADDLIAGMERVWGHLTAAVRPTSYFVGSKNAYEAWKKATATMALAGNVPAVSPDLRPKPMARASVALTIPGQVNYCAEAFDLSEVGGAFSTRLNVVGMDIFSRYFWDEIRAKGGAYGAGATALREGIVAFTSYRDPRVADTYSVFDHLPDWVEANMPDQSGVDALIVSTVGSGYFRPGSPMDQGREALARYLQGLTVADRAAEIADILSTTPADFLSYANAIRSLKAKGCGIRAVLGNADLIRKSGLFSEDEITEL